MLMLAPLNVGAHGSYEEHCAEMMAVFGFQPQPKLKAWTKFIGSDMIDNREPFYSDLKLHHPGFKCKHRLLFHWGYNSRPWSDVLEERVLRYCKEVGAKSPNDTILLFQQELRVEQARRNGLINRRTEELFGFGDNGKDAMYANRMASMAYNIHLLGDYTSDNKDLSGLISIDRLVGSIITDIRTLAPEAGKELIKGITSINRSEPDTQLKADKLMTYLMEEFPKFFRQVDEGSLARRLEKRGFKLKNNNQ